MLAYAVAIIFAAIWEIIFIGRGSIEILDVFIHTPVIIYPLLIVLSGVLFYAIYRKAWIGVVYVVLFLGFIPIQDFSNFTHSPPTTEPLRLTSWNINGWSDSDEFLQSLYAIDSEIVLLQEVWPETLSNETFQAFANSNPDKFMDRVGEFVVISDFPLSNIDYSADHRGFAAYDVTLPLGNIRLINTHLSAPFLVPDAVEVRSKQLAALQSEISNYDKVVLAGDFNTQSSHGFMKGFEDEFAINEYSRPGIMATWPADFPLMRIDYGLFQKDAFVLHDYDQYCENELSDHCLVTHAFTTK